MLVKASIAATLVIGAVMTATSIDFRELYNEMYPVNGLKRDVLGVCHQAKPTFVRAIEADRVNCYDSMPDPVEMAIGWVRTSSRLAALRKTPTAVETAERLLDAVVAQRRAGIADTVPLTGYLKASTTGARPCDDKPKGLAPVTAGADRPGAMTDEQLARRIASGDQASLAALGLAPRGPEPKTGREQKLPPIPLAAAGKDVTPKAVAPASGLQLQPVPEAVAAGCRTPA